jgi:hypothetical protein
MFQLKEHTLELRADHELREHGRCGCDVLGSAVELKNGAAACIFRAEAGKQP